MIDKITLTGGTFKKIRCLMIMNTNTCKTIKRIIAAIFIVTIVSISSHTLAQTETILKASPEKPSNTNKKKQEPKLISAGVVNGRALNLVQPEYPKSACVSGTVRVEIIIDTAGYVLEAKIISGHPLLREPSVEAAKNSKFAPVFLDDIPVKVKGILVYNFFPNKINWLEIGYFSAETERTFISLPDDFVDAKNIILKMNSTDTPYDPDGFKNLVLSLENKLRTDEKHLWLFQLGITLRKLIDNPWDQEPKINLVTKIQTLLYLKPQNVSPNLIIKLENLVKLHQEDKELFEEEFMDIFDNFYIFGK